MTLDELIQDERDEARAEGFSKGKAEGIEQGKAEGLKDALKILGVSKEEFERIKNTH